LCNVKQVYFQYPREATDVLHFNSSHGRVMSKYFGNSLLFVQTVDKSNVILSANVAPVNEFIMP